MNRTSEERTEDLREYFEDFIEGLERLAGLCVERDSSEGVVAERLETLGRAGIDMTPDTLTGMVLAYQQVITLVSETILVLLEIGIIDRHGDRASQALATILMGSLADAALVLLRKGVTV